MDDRIRALLDKDEVTAAITELFLATDERDWERVVRYFTPQVHFDMVSMGVAEPLEVDAESIAHMWNTGLTPIRHVHHQIGNVRIELAGDEADASCYGTAYHFLPDAKEGNTRLFVGTYDFHLVRDEGRWLIDAFRFNLKFITGNENLEDGL